MERQSTVPREAALRVRTLGRFTIEVEGTPLPLGVKARRRPLELLKLLVALGGSDVPTRALADVLWPDSDGDTAQRTLTTNLHRLRELIGPDVIRLEHGRLSLVTAVCAVDALRLPELWHEAREALEMGDDQASWEAAAEAMECYGGPFLDGDEEPAEVLVARERLQALHLRAVVEAAKAWEARDAIDRAVALYEHGLGVDDTAEQLHQGLMRCLQHAGRVAEALTVYERCQSLLATRLERPPAPETQQIYRELTAKDDAAVPEATGRSQAAVSPTSGQPVPGRRRWVAVVAVLLAAAVLGAFWLAWQDTQDAGVAVMPVHADPSIPVIPAQPSIAVLPFANLSGDPAEEYFSDGFSENLISRLAGLSDLLVIARTSSFAYKGKAVDVRQVGRELGVRHVLEGSVMVADGRVRITAQLIDASAGKHLWSEHYDRGLGGLFAVMDEITQAIVTEMAVKLTRGERARIAHRATASVEALRLYLQAQRYNWTFARDANLRARELTEAALRLDPDYASAVALLGWTHMLDAAYGWAAVPATSYRRAEELARRAIALAPTEPSAFVLLSRAYVVRREFDKAVAAGRKAVEVAPNDANAVGQLSHLLVYAGQAAESLVPVRTALRLEPYPRNYLLYFAGDSYFFAGNPENAIGWYRRFLERQPTGRMAQFCWSSLIAAHMQLDQLDEARTAVEEVLTVHPDFTVEKAVQNLRRLPFRDHGFLEPYSALLRRAGLPLVAR